MTKEQLIERANKRWSEFKRLVERHNRAAKRANDAIRIRQRLLVRAREANVQTNAACDKAKAAGVDPSLLDQAVCEKEWVEFGVPTL